MTASPRVDDMTISFSAASGPIPEDKSISVKIPERDRPQLIYTWQLQDTDNDDGVFEPGEELRMFISVKNIGKEETIDTEIELSAKPGIDVIQGILDLNTLKPNATAEGVLKLRVVKDFPLNEAELSLAFRDWYKTENGVPATRTLIEREIRLPISTIPNKLEKSSGTVSVQKETPLLESPSKEGRITAMATGGASFSYDAVSGSYFRVQLSKERRAWLEKESATLGGKVNPLYTPSFYEPPTIEISGTTVRKVSSSKALVEGVATHPNMLRDLIIFAEDQKVLYLQASQKAQKKIAFSTEVPLKEGVNHITIVARHDDKVLGTAFLFIRRNEKKK